MRLTDIFKFKLFEGTDKADLEVVNENFEVAEDAMQAHAAGGDHDGRYLKKAEVVNNNTTTAAGYALDARQANPDVAGSLGAQIHSLNNNLINKIYPVGSIYMSVSNVSPASFLGGTWEQIQNRFLLAAGSSYAAGVTGGAAAHTLSAAEMPSHNHGFSATSAYASNDHTHGFSATTGTVSADHAHTGYTSVGGAHTHNMRIRRDNSVGGGTDRIGNANGHAEVQTTNMESSGNHNHTVQTYGFSANHIHGVSGTTGGINVSHTHGVSGNTAAAGGGVAHNNMPPYLAVYMWKRTK